MVKIKFRYKDEMSKGNWSYQECAMSSVEGCKKVYGLDWSDPTLEDYEILDVKEY